jgi:predicted amidohydrolase YtcJ
MTYLGPGFVDHHAHALRVMTGAPPPWGDPSGVRQFHHDCVEHGVSPVDVEDPEGDVDLVDLTTQVLDGAARSGLVELWEAGIRSWRYLDALLELREAGAPLPVRVRLLVAAGLAEAGMRPRVGDAWVEIEGVKFYADGWLGSRTCALSSSFRDEPDNRGLLFQSAERLARRIEPFARDGWLVATHAIGDRAIETVLDAYEQVYGDDVSSAAPRIEHAQVLREDLVSRIAELGVVVCIQPGFAVDDEHHASTALGADWPAAYRWDRLLDAGVRVVGGSDFPIDALEPLRGLQKLVRNPFSPMDVATAYSLMSSAGAGTVELGCSPMDCDEDEIGAIPVLSTTPAPL